jgi:hypothetical protein
MSSRRNFIGRLILAPAGAGLSILAAASLVGCGEGQPQQTTSTPLGNRDSRDAQRAVEVPASIPKVDEKAKGK